MTVSPEKAPEKPEYIEIGFEKGDPVSLNGDLMKPVQLLRQLNEIAGRHGVGRVDIVENRLVGIKSRGIYETPGGTLLHQAHRDIESITIEKGAQHLKDELSTRYARLVYNGQWFSHEREALQALIDKTQMPVKGVVRLKLYKGGSWVVGRRSDASIYNDELASFESEELYNQLDAQGFIRLFSLSSKMSYTKK